MKSITLAALVLTAAAPSAFGAQWRHYDRYDRWHYHRGGNGLLPFVLGGVVGAVIENQAHARTVVVDSRRDDIRRLEDRIADDRAEIRRLERDDDLTTRERNRRIDRLEDEIDRYRDEIDDLRR